MAVVTNVYHDQGREWWAVNLCCSTPEMGTDLDLYVPMGIATPYPLVIHCELYGQMFPEQMVKVVGYLPPEYLQAITGSLRSDGETVETLNHINSQRYCLIPLGGLLDPRYRWLEGWLPTLTALSSPVRHLLLG